MTEDWPELPRRKSAVEVLQSTMYQVSEIADKRITELETVIAEQRADCQACDDGDHSLITLAERYETLGFLRSYNEELATENVELHEKVRRLEFMIENGLGPEDMNHDFERDSL